MLTTVHGTFPSEGNPFSACRGFMINGHWLSKAQLLSSSFPTLPPNALAAVTFAQSLFDPAVSISVETSGSTGNPQHLSFPKSAFWISAEATNTAFDLAPERDTFLSLPMRYIAAKMMVARAVCAGHRLRVIEPAGNPQSDFDPIFFASFTPYQVEQMIKNENSLLRRIETILIGGAPISEHLLQSLVDKKVNAYASFGMAETLSHFALSKLQHPSNIVFKPLPDVALDMDEWGRLMVHYPGITDGWLRTNDLVEFVDDGFAWLGRVDNLINSGGVKIIPEKLEKFLAPYIEDPFFVHGLADKALGQRAVLFVEGKFTPDLKRIPWQSRFDTPKEVVHIVSFERTLSGKIRRESTVNKWIENSKKST